MQSTTILKLAIFIVAGALFCGGQAKAGSQRQAAAVPDPAAQAGSQAAEPAPVRGVAQFSEHNPRYSLRPGDTMDLAFNFSPEFNQSVTVQPDGFVTLREIGDVHVAGQTVPQVTTTIKDAYTKILNDPAVSIVLRDFEKPYFIAAGDVGKPGKYELRGDTTLTEAVAIAGGFNEKSKHSKVVLYRKTSNEWMEGRVVDVKKMMASRNLSEDIHLNPGDMVFVPQNTYSKIQRYIPAPGIGMGIPAF
jgi:polysaccharide export outer membrane protein